MNLTDYHAKYFAHELTKRCPSDSLEKLAGAVAGAQVDLNPHQVDAALFAFHSPLSKGALIADEVGLGKTIEAGLVISQKWAERKRRILVIVPCNLRKQWYQELNEKFFLPCQLLETKSYNVAVRQGNFRPFEAKDKIVICSYQFARKQAPDVANTAWDLVVIDEAHRLRNVYKPTNIIANTLKQALKNVPTLLLTATPLQNSLLELFGLVSFIDEHAFGDLKAFREQFANLSQEKVFDTLKSRLKPICHRTLRRQVTAYVPFTKRHPILEEFTPEESEDRLYELVSEYLRRENLQALPASQRSLMTLVLRKLLASSTFAIAGALASISERLKAKIKKEEPVVSLEEELDQDYEALNETAEEWSEEEDSPEPISDADRAAIEAEIADLDEFARLATSIEQNAKGKALVKALDIAFKNAVELGAAEKAVIFTESRKTQSYLLRVLADSPFKDGIVLFNGSNTDERSRAIYAAWLERHAGTDRVSGSKTADLRSALVDNFREEGRIMIATEAGAEGINLQFCSLVVNYDLPWNPQRIEQRIGRCHRYGQKHDVVVARAYLHKHPAPTVCPLCESAEKVQGLNQRISGRLASFSSLQTAQAQTKTAGAGAERLEQQLEALRESAKKHAEDFEKARAGFAWSADITMPASPAPLDIEALETWLVGAAHLPAEWKKAETVRQDKKQFIGALKRALKTYTENVQAQKELDTLLPNLNRTLGIVEEERRLFSDNILAKIAGEVGRIYELVHPGEGLNKISLELDPNKRASLEIGASFCGETGAPPQAYFSDSHLDTLGLCVFLALAGMDGPENTILVLDDVLASVDEPHVERLIEMLYAEAIEFRHCLITTHYRPWKEKLRWGWLKNGQCQFIELAKWTNQHGMTLIRSIPDVERLRILLAETPPDPQLVCAKAGVILEAALDFLTQLYECSVPRRPGGLYTLGDLLPSIPKKLRNALQVEVLVKDAAGASSYQTKSLTPILDELILIAQARNVFGCHFNALSFELLDSDALGFGQKVLELIETLADPDAGWPRNSKSGKYWANSGETRRLHPLQQPT